MTIILPTQCFCCLANFLVVELEVLTDLLRRNRGVFLRSTACNASRVLAIIEASVRFSVRPSVTLVVCTKTVQTMDHEISAVGCPKDFSLS